MWMGKFLPALCMIFLMGVLTVGNAFLYNTDDQHISYSSPIDADDDIDTSKRPIGPDEEKSSKRVASGNLAEEYLHEHHPFVGLDDIIAHAENGYIHPHGFGDDHSRLHSPPPDSKI